LTLNSHFAVDSKEELRQRFGPRLNHPSSYLSAVETVLVVGAATPSHKLHLPVQLLVVTGRTGAGTPTYNAVSMCAEPVCACEKNLLARAKHA